jgi:Rad3-related DNA helicase
MNYEEFIQSKRHLIGEFGFTPNYIPDKAFDFQAYIIEKAVKKGRMAIFADTGLGKTLMQISIAKNIVNHTNKSVLILTPLAVAFQFIQMSTVLLKFVKKLLFVYLKVNLLNIQQFVCLQFLDLFLK